MGILFDAAVLWFIVVYVTQDHGLPFRDVMLWRLIAAAAGGLCYLGLYFLDLRLLGFAAWIVVSLVVLYFLLGRQGYSRKQILTILAVYMGANALRFGARLLFYTL